MLKKIGIIMTFISVVGVFMVCAGCHHGDHCCQTKLQRPLSE
ncbi:MAG: hypothetical protein QY310_06225 [Candidatus Jettenia sp. CY-1]|nr:MAG: hypothetical protein QY310_06225 [Candidatus Jettenia sp. CY-1]